MNGKEDSESFNLGYLFEKQVSISVATNEKGEKIFRLNGIGTIDHLNKEITASIAGRIGLLFLERREDGNVCFANNNEEIRDEFKQVFEPADVLNYVLGVLQGSPESKDISNPEIPYPADADFFWEKVNAGKHIRM